MKKMKNLLGIFETSSVGSEPGKVVGKHSLGYAGRGSIGAIRQRPRGVVEKWKWSSCSHSSGKP